MKKYLVFFGYIYYPSRGIKDLEGSADTVEEARNIIDENKETFWWWQIVDRDTFNIIEEGEN